ncbi:MAG: hypothetical protein DMG34_11165 [Acidobacteria bacterium]|nr:MAG: hypothetical protein DMG34_11165 [Acidobacteriota bacterium]
MGSRNLKIDSVLEALLDRDIEPCEEFERIQVVNHSQRIEFVQARHDVPIFDVGQTADMQNEIGAAASRRELITGRLNITVGQPKPFANLA